MAGFWNPAGQRPGPVARSSHHTTVVSPSIAASVIVTPSSTVRTIVSARIDPAENVGCDTGPPGGDDKGVGTCIISRLEPVSSHRHAPIAPGRQ